MGTSSPYAGPGGGNPLVPTWLDPDGNGEPPNAPEDGQDGPDDTGTPDNGTAPPETGTPDGSTTPGATPSSPLRPLPQVPLDPYRFTATRNNLSRFAGTDGRDRASLGRAVAGYVSTASGGARKAAQRMGSSRRAGAQLLGFLADAQTRGARAALSALDLESLAGRPIEEIFAGLTDYICPDGGTVDEGISREAFVETIVDLAEFGIYDLDALTADQMQTVFELFATHAIEARLCNDIGAKAITLPHDVRTASLIQTQLRDFIARAVSDALTRARMTPESLTADRVLGFVGRVYEDAFRILQAMGEAEAAA